MNLCVYLFTSSISPCTRSADEIGVFPLRAHKLRLSVNTAAELHHLPQGLVSADAGDGAVWRGIVYTGDPPQWQK